MVADTRERLERMAVVVAGGVIGAVVGVAWGAPILAGWWAGFVVAWVLVGPVGMSIR